MYYITVKEDITFKPFRSLSDRISECNFKTDLIP